MNYSHVQQLKPSDFRRYCGVSLQVFSRLANMLRPHLPQPGQRGGQPSFSIEDQLLITLEYWREYRTYFHMAQSWDTCESTIYRIVQRVEAALSAIDDCHLPGKKRLEQLQSGLELVVVDVMETPIERPQKNNGLTIAARRNDTPSNPNSSSS